MRIRRPSCNCDVDNCARHSPLHNPRATNFDILRTGANFRLASSKSMAPCTKGREHRHPRRSNILIFCLVPACVFLGFWVFFATAFFADFAPFAATVFDFAASCSAANAFLTSVSVRMAVTRLLRPRTEAFLGPALGNGCTSVGSNCARELVCCGVVFVCCSGCGVRDGGVSWKGKTAL